MLQAKWESEYMSRPPTPTCTPTEASPSSNQGAVQPAWPDLWDRKENGFGTCLYCHSTVDSESLYVMPPTQQSDALDQSSLPLA
jgi:hypothetical protein